jgi:Sigma-70, region 4
MSSLDTLPPDQRAVLDLVLQRGRSYDDIARLLGIDRAAVRARALAAFDALGPETGITEESRALIADYLLGQLPDRVAEQTRERLAAAPYERAWARVVASELSQMANGELPEIPDGSRPVAASARPADAPAREAGGGRAGDGGGGARDGGGAAGAGTGTGPPRPHERRRPPRLSDRPSSRLGGAIMLIVGALVVVLVVVVLLVVLSGSSSSKHTSTPAAQAARTSSSSTSTSASQAQVVAQSNLNPPSGTSSQTKGVAFVVKEGAAYGIVIEAAHVPPNNHNAYAAWLYNSAGDAYRIGFVSPAVGKSGQLQVGSPLPTNAGHFRQLLLSVETQSNPKSPGQILLQGPFSLTSSTG